MSDNQNNAGTLIVDDQMVDDLAMTLNELWKPDGSVSESFINKIAAKVPSSLREPWTVEMLSLIADLKAEQRSREEIEQAFEQEAKEAMRLTRRR